MSKLLYIGIHQVATQLWKPGVHRGSAVVSDAGDQGIGTADYKILSTSYSVHLLPQ